MHFVQHTIRGIGQFNNTLTHHWTPLPFCLLFHYWQLSNRIKVVPLNFLKNSLHTTEPLFTGGARARGRVHARCYSRIPEKGMPGWEGGWTLPPLSSSRAPPPRKMRAPRGIPKPYITRRWSLRRSVQLRTRHQYDVQEPNVVVVECVVGFVGCLNHTATAPPGLATPQVHCIQVYIFSITYFVRLKWCK